MNMRHHIKELLVDALHDLSIDSADDIVEVALPANPTQGDYATNLALKLAKSRGENPRELAQQLVNHLKAQSNAAFASIEIAGPGFINFNLSTSVYAEQLQTIFVQQGRYGFNTDSKGRKVIAEYTDPNPFKEFHIGHLMSNSIGESISRVIEANGAEVKRANYQGDVGMHVAMSVWGMQQKMTDESLSLADLSARSLRERIQFLGQSYAKGATAYKDSDTAKLEITAINKHIFLRDEGSITKLFETGRQWSLDYFETIYKKLGTHFDYYFFESDAGPKGKKVVEEYLEKGIFNYSDGAVIFPGEQYGLHTRVFINSHGLPTYEAKELGLSKTKYELYPYDLSIIVTANEINDYFKVLLKAMSFIYPELAEKTKHLSHGVLKLPTGKMSSRTGKVVTGTSLLNDVIVSVKEKMASAQVGRAEMATDETVEAIAVGAIKFAMLRQGIGKDIIFDFEQSLSLEGDSGPYLQYAYARCQSVLSKSATKEPIFNFPDAIVDEERGVLTHLARFPEVVEDAGRSYAPNLICSYAIELAQRYNRFYNAELIIGSENEAFRLALTRATAQVLANALQLLGIKTVERM